MNKLKRYKLLIAFVGLMLLGFVIRYFAGEKGILWKMWGLIDTTSAVALAVLAFFAYKKMVRDEDKIKLYFKIDNKLIDTGFVILRKDCTRGEVLGIIGMMQRKTDKRFTYDPKYLKELMQEVNLVQTTNKKSIEVPISKDDFEQFII